MVFPAFLLLCSENDKKFVCTLIFLWPLFRCVGVYARDEVGPPILILKMLGSGYFKKVTSAFQSVIVLAGSTIPRLGLLRFRSV